MTTVLNVSQDIGISLSVGAASPMGKRRKTNADNSMPATTAVKVAALAPQAQIGIGLPNTTKLPGTRKLLDVKPALTSVSAVTAPLKGKRHKVKAGNLGNSAPGAAAAKGTALVPQSPTMASSFEIIPQVGPAIHAVPGPYDTDESVLKEAAPSVRNIVMIEPNESAQTETVRKTASLSVKGNKSMLATIAGIGLGLVVASATITKEAVLGAAADRIVYAQNCPPVEINIADNKCLALLAAGVYIGIGLFAISAVQAVAEHCRSKVNPSRIFGG